MPRKKRSRNKPKQADRSNVPAASNRSAVRSSTARSAPKIDDVAQHVGGLRLEDMTSRDLSADWYSTLNTHEDFLKDRNQIRIYRQAICGNRHLFRDKIVLDVNCGLGILSLFARKAGAKHVYAIDTSNITQLTRQIVKDNRLDDVITVIRGAIDAIQLPVEQVDVIVTYFRGSIYSFDETLCAVFAARDKWLRPDGLIFPDSCSLYISGTNDTRYHNHICDYWLNVYDFKMPAIQKAVLREPIRTRVNYDKVVTDACKLRTINFYTTSKSELRKFDSMFRLHTRDRTTVAALFVYFQIGFGKCHIPLELSMAPDAPTVHWKQTVFLLPHSSACHSVAPHEIYGVFRFASSADDSKRFDFIIDLCIGHERATYREQAVYELR